VTTNNGRSDWATQPWSFELQKDNKGNDVCFGQICVGIRLQNDSILVEFSAPPYTADNKATEPFLVGRIAPFNLSDSANRGEEVIRCGIYTCAPGKHNGARAVCHRLLITPCSPHTHDF